MKRVPAIRQGRDDAVYTPCEEEEYEQKHTKHEYKYKSKSRICGIISPVHASARRANLLQARSPSMLGKDLRA
uniref:Uncharacterized protein n=1 Tax=Romanomermis culicivorax TaxID=13658 RepID=A0A915J008_ROMCU